MDVSPWMNAQGGPSDARRAKEGASADSAEEMKDTTGLRPWWLYWVASSHAGETRREGKLKGLQVEY